ncbi:hypothetical protein Q1695_001005 [Nippostrongylus brasiliensis]|nr:hypothetical protein Q1695_001005 [Nippostrongylus brasiliensis]
MWILLLLPVLALGQEQQQLDPTAVAQNVDNFRRLYGIATRIMELSGSFMGQQSRTGSGGPWDELHPTFRSAAGSRTFEADNTVTGGSDSSDHSRFREDLGFLRFLTTQPPTTTPKPYQSGIQGLLNTFFGSSVNEGEALPPPPTPRPRPAANLFNFLGAPPPQQPQRQQGSSNLGQIDLWELFGVTRRTTTTTASPLQSLLNPQIASSNTQNIDAVFNALMRSNAQPERSQPSPNVLSQFFGR